MDEKELGLDQSITRRDFVHGAAFTLAAAAAGCGPSETQTPTTEEPVTAPDYDFELGPEWYGPGGTGDYANSHGNTPDLVRAAHEIRAGAPERAWSDALDDGGDYDLIVVGGGFAGLSAAHHFRRLNPGGRALVLDNHPIFGGEAKRNEFMVRGIRISGPQGSNDTGVLPATGEPDDYFTSLGIPRDLRYVQPDGAASDMRIPTDNYAFLYWQHDQFDVGHHFPGVEGASVKDFWNTGLESLPWPDPVKAAFAGARRLEVEGRQEGELGPWLDSMTVKHYYETVLGLPPEFTAYVDPILASIIGLGCDAISAWWGLHFELPGFRPPDRYADLDFHSFPGGNAGIARHFLKDLVPDGIGGGSSLDDVLFGSVAFDRLDRAENPVRLRLASTAVRVEHQGPAGSGQRVRVMYQRAGQYHVARGRMVVMASGGWVNRHIVRELPTGHRRAYETVGHSPVLVANVALSHWRFLERLGVSAAIWGGGFGFSANIRRPMEVGPESEPCHPDDPIVLTFYIPLYRPGMPLLEQGPAARGELLTTSFAEYERRIREQMVTLFSGAGFNPATDIAGIILNRWGHAYVNPGPGFMFGSGGQPAPPDVIREPIGRIAIGHSELQGHQNWVGAAAEGRRALETLLERYG
ncbi:MAG: NAD(P)-binding protein [Gemmatimonadetes bacterium]|nr:NAD(P)-binding protein [Gemmatimonadota bacterium]